MNGSKNGVSSDQKGTLHKKKRIEIVKCVDLHLKLRMKFKEYCKQHLVFDFIAILGIFLCWTESKSKF